MKSPAKSQVMVNTECLDERKWDASWPVNEDLVCLLIRCRFDGRVKSSLGWVFVGNWEGIVCRA